MNKTLTMARTTGDTRCDHDEDTRRYDHDLSWAGIRRVGAEGHTDPERVVRRRAEYHEAGLSNLLCRCGLEGKVGPER